MIIVHRRVALAAVVALVGAIVPVTVFGRPGPAPAVDRPASERSTAGAATSAWDAVVSVVDGLGDVAADVGRQARDAAGELAAMPGSGRVSLGGDGRLTVMLIGSDWRPGVPGDRFDTIMVVSVNPANGNVAAASIPRDTVRFKKHSSNGGGTSGNTRVNLMYDGLALGTRLSKFEKDVEANLGIQIDNYVYIRFTGFDRMLDEIGGLSMTIPKAVRDKGYNDDPNGSSPYGVFFPALSGYFLGGTVTRCPSWHVNCHRALPYARSRKGTEGSGSNSDWKRAARQQKMVIAAMRQVQNWELDDLVDRANDGANLGVVTNIPISMSSANQIYGYVHDASFRRKVVFKPPAYAYHQSGTPAFTFTLRGSKVRAWVNRWMEP